MSDTKDDNEKSEPPPKPPEPKPPKRQPEALSVPTELLATK